jgi:hypothetical protein
MQGSVILFHFQENYFLYRFSKNPQIPSDFMKICLVRPELIHAEAHTDRQNWHLSQFSERAWKQWLTVPLCSQNSVLQQCGICDNTAWHRNIRTPVHSSGTHADIISLAAVQPTIIFSLLLILFHKFTTYFPSIFFKISSLGYSSKNSSQDLLSVLKTHLVARRRCLDIPPWSNSSPAKCKFSSTAAEIIVCKG